MNIERVYKIGVDTMYLAVCALHNRVPEKSKLLDMDINGVYKMAKRHSMQAIVYLGYKMGLDNYSDLDFDLELLKKWEKAYKLSLHKLVMFDVEREALCNFLKENNIWYCCLKGVVLQNYYPILGMRQMADNDILVDTKGCAKIRNFMISHGYEVEHYGSGCHDVYIKGALDFEIHRKLFPEGTKTYNGSDYYRNVKNMLVKKDDSCELHFTDEEFYVYYICHAYKHFSGGGCGIRTLLDIFVYINNMSGKLDMDAVKKSLGSLGIERYEENSRSLAFELVSKESLDSEDYGYNLSDEYRSLLEYYITSGTYGTVERSINNSLSLMSNGNDIDDGVKVKYFFRRIFPDMDYYRNAYPRLSKIYPIIPILWLMRLFRGIGKSKKYVQEVKQVNKK